MQSFFSTDRKIGILGGGQLGKMLALAAAPWDFYLKVLDPSSDAPARYYVKEFVTGDFRDYTTVMNFGSDCDVISIEIEDINIQALYDLQRLGKKIYPQPRIIEIFQDKQRQKSFYTAHHIPTSSYKEFGDKKHLAEFLTSHQMSYPLVWKAARGGFDGRGVAMIHSVTDIDRLPDGACILEEYIEIMAETAVVVHRSEQGEVVCQPVVQMEFHPKAHFVELIYTPSMLDSSIKLRCLDIARLLADTLQLVGTLAVEFFVTRDHQVLINEAAPRVHNSGHLTIEAVPSSQFEQHLRAITGLPLGDSQPMHHAVMLNLTGHSDFEGKVYYQGAESVLKIPSAFLHLYGKSITKPYRKMGHITLIGDDVAQLLTHAHEIKDLLNVISR